MKAESSLLAQTWQLHSYYSLYIYALNLDIFDSEYIILSLQVF